MAVTIEHEIITFIVYCCTIVQGRFSSMLSATSKARASESDMPIVELLPGSVLWDAFCEAATCVPVPAGGSAAAGGVLSRLKLDRGCSWTRCEA